MLVQNLIDTPPELGVLGSVFTLTVGLIWWALRNARKDTLMALGRAETLESRFSEYLQKSAAHQTEVLVGVANQLQRLTTTMADNETRAQKRHEESMSEFRHLNGHGPTGSTS